MFFIAHRGNIDGPNPESENRPEYIQRALSQGYYVEVDVWYIGDKLFLGHDYPQYDTDWNFLSQSRLICHAKNEEALNQLIQRDIHCFGHDRDNVVLTSRNWLWTYPGKQLTCNSIAVMPEMTKNWNLAGCKGVCSDYITFSKP